MYRNASNPMYPNVSNSQVMVYDFAISCGPLAFLAQFYPKIAKVDIRSLLKLKKKRQSSVGRSSNEIAETVFM